MVHHAEWFVFISVFQKFDSLVCYDVRSVAFLYDMLAILPKIRIIVVSLLMLTAENTPVIETLRFTDEVPFTNYGCLVAGLLEQFWEGLLIAIECACIIRKAVFRLNLPVRIHAREGPERALTA